jgi:sigma-B regulation protein RsbU (phosphoserine phosphatase)
MSDPTAARGQAGARPPTDTELLSTLLELGRDVMSVLDLEELLAKIPQLIARLTRFSAFSVYLLDEKRQELRIGYAIGYPDGVAPTMRLRMGQGVVGAAVAEGRPILVNDVRQEPRYMGPLRNMLSQLAVPMRRKGRVIGALNLLDVAEGAFTAQDEILLRQFAAHVAAAIENARLFRSERHYVDTLETLAEVGREMSSILELDVLLTRIASLTKRLIDYRTFGIFLLNEATSELEMKLAVRYGKGAELRHITLGDGLVGWAALHKEPVLVADVAKDPRYINLVEDVQSELAIPMLIKDRCVGVFDLESPELDAFTKEHQELLTLLASQAAVAIDNARLYAEVRQNEERIEKELRFAQRVQAALVPELPKSVAGVAIARRFEAARELGGDLHDFLTPEPNTLVVAVGDVSGKGAPAALYGAFAGELVRARTLRRRFTPDRFSVAGVLQAMNTALHGRELEEYYCTLCYAFFDLGRRTVTLSNSGLPYPIRCAGEGGCAEIQIPGVPLGAFAGTTYDEVTFELQQDDVFVFCTDGILEAVDEHGEEFGARRVSEIVTASRGASPQAIVDGIFDAVEEFRGSMPHADDMTVVALKMTS